MARPRTPLLSRDGIVAAALALVDAEGLEALSTRRLAAELGVSGPSLYNHVATKDELIDAVVDCVVAAVDVSAFAGLVRSDVGELGGIGGIGGIGAIGDSHETAARLEVSQGANQLGDGIRAPANVAANAAVNAAVTTSATGEESAWREALATWARSYREVLAAHPNVVPALARGSGRRPAQLRIADAVFGGLVDAGWPRREATSIGALMRSLVIGSALGSFAAGFPADASVYAGVYPHLNQAHLLAEHQREIDDRAFEVGLTAVLDGLEMRLAALRAGELGGTRG
ncbi:TetR/AcrR family transcriptional regulator C-terminal domain-containing protein [Catenulispora sp. NF23]|uniref:TetR/AcrR family transcriptional regulator C-terminal domain-containing protein n=1 Tax=Catenulispora pinistramenti TaxID=2705254 RepID=UPI001BAC169C|nr:TetR/AcrR family transcriptional regulator C-terminal domain-containing protein [Catenulispora pinistramenti]MBS2538899.1 TetR/AcrR family transcriptional regulator C-terminal domain-containing protein [Catenulispora pinistramenti]